MKDKKPLGQKHKFAQSEHIVSQIRPFHSFIGYKSSDAFAKFTTTLVRPRATNDQLELQSVRTQRSSRESEIVLEIPDTHARAKTNAIHISPRLLRIQFLVLGYFCSQFAVHVECFYFIMNTQRQRTHSADFALASEIKYTHRRKHIVALRRGVCKLYQIFSAPLSFLLRRLNNCRDRAHSSALENAFSNLGAAITYATWAA